MSSRRRSVSAFGSFESGQSRRDQNLAGLRSCSTRFSVDVDDVITPTRRPRTRSQTQAPEPQVPDNMSVDEEENWTYANEGFSQQTDLEKLRYESCKRRIIPNLNLDYDLLIKLGFMPSIEKAFGNLTWSDFIHHSASYYLDLALEMMVTMDIVQSSNLVDSLRFRVREDWKIVSLRQIGTLLGFRESAPEDVEVGRDILEDFWSKISLAQRRKEPK